MAAGRPPAWNPFRAKSLGGWTEAVLLATKERVPLPVAVRNMLSLECPGRLVADLAVAGTASLMTEGEFEAMHEALVAKAKDAARVAIAALDRFQAVPVTAEGRLVLSVALRSHLGALVEPAVRLVVDDGRLSLWSEEAWRAGRAERLKVVDEALASG